MALVRPGNAPLELNSRSGYAVNNGPSLVYYGDSQDVSTDSYDGTLAAGAMVTMTGAMWFVGGPAEVYVLAMPDVNDMPGTPGPAGPTGNTGATGPAGPAGTTGATEIVLPYAKTGVLAVETGTNQPPIPFNAQILNVVASLGVGGGPTGSSVIVDLNKNGMSMFTTQGNRPSVAASVPVGGEVGIPAVPDRILIRANDRLTVDIDQVGSAVAGSNLTVMVYLQKLSSVPATYDSIVSGDAPIAYWRLQETSGTTAADSSGNSHPGTYNGTVTLNVAGAIGGSTAMSVAGVGYLRAPLDLGSQNKLTVEFFLNWGSYSTSNQRVLEYSDGVTSGANVANGFYMVPNGSGGTFDVGMYNGTVFAGSSFQRPSAGVYHHYVIELDRSASSNTGAVKMWVDGIAQTATPFSGNSIAGGNFRANGTITAMADNAGANLGTGIIDELAIYGGLMSGTRIAAHINAV